MDNKYVEAVLAMENSSSMNFTENSVNCQFFFYA